MDKKKVEEKNKKNNQKLNSVKKKEKVVEAIVEEDTVVCEECGKSYSSSLKECPKCGYSPVVKKKTFYDDEDDFEDFDDEDEDFVSKKEVNLEVEIKEEKEEVVKEKTKDSKAEKNKKENKKENKNIHSANNKKVSVEKKKSMWNDDSNEIFGFIKILIVIVLLVAIVWVIAAVVNKEFDDESKDDEKEVTATIQNDKILASSIFNKKDDSYYVFAFNADDDNHWAVYYSMLFSEYDYIENKDKLPMFWVDLNDPLNKDIVASKVEEENKNPKKYEELKIYSPALIRIKNGKLDKYYDGSYAVDKILRLIESFKEETK